jgi:hypothetical protein
VFLLPGGEFHIFEGPKEPAGLHFAAHTIEVALVHEKNDLSIIEVKDVVGLNKAREISAVDNIDSYSIGCLIWGVNSEENLGSWGQLNTWRARRKDLLVDCGCANLSATYLNKQGTGFVWTKLLRLCKFAKDARICLNHLLSKRVMITLLVP